MTLSRQLEDYRAPDSLLEPNAPAPANPTEATMAREYSAPGESAMLRSAILYQADWRPPGDGIARHARAQARALAATGLPVILRSISSSGGMLLDADAGPEVQAEVGHLNRSSAGDIPISIRQMVIHSADFIRNVVAPPAARFAGFEQERRVYESSIIYTGIERDRVSANIAKMLRRCAAVWVPCRANAEALVKSGVPYDKVFVVPYPYDPSVGASTIAAPRGSEVIVPDGQRFYTIGKWEPRKDHHKLIGAFLREFTPNERASLYIKTSQYMGGWKDYPSMAASLRFWAADETVRKKGWSEANIERRVRIDTRFLPEKTQSYTLAQYEDASFRQNVLSKLPRLTEPSTMLAIHRANNIYVSASHGEAWELGAFDAKCAGNTLVHVGYGGAEEYADPKTDVSPSTRWAPVHPGYGWEPDAQWTEYEIEDLSAAMRAAPMPLRRVHPTGFYNRFGARAVGELMAGLALKMCDADAAKRLTEAGGFG